MECDFPSHNSFYINDNIQLNYQKMFDKVPCKVFLIFHNQALLLPQNI